MNQQVKFFHSLIFEYPKYFCEDKTSLVQTA